MIPRQPGERQLWDELERRRKADRRRSLWQSAAMAVAAVATYAGLVYWLT